MKRWARMTAGGALIVSIVAATGGCHQSPPRAGTSRQAVVITQRYWVERVPDANLSRFSVDARDRGETWELTYRWLGEQTILPSRFVVEKQSGKIVSADFHPREEPLTG